jgi:hypothetical protein
MENGNKMPSGFDQPRGGPEPTSRDILIIIGVFAGIALIAWIFW